MVAKFAYGFLFYFGNAAITSIGPGKRPVTAIPQRMQA